MNPASQRLNQLTFTRFLAALSVLLYHSGRSFGILQYFPFLTSGQTAVNYFFVLSGLVMAYVYYRPVTEFKFREYFLARFSRIYPVYIISFILTALYFINILPKTKTDEIFSNIFLFQAWKPEYSSSYNIAAWSLSVEVFFYILVPALIFVALKQPVKRIIWLSLGFWAFSQILHSLLFFTYDYVMPNFFLAFFPPFHLNTFLIGFAGGVWLLNKPVHKPISSPINLLLLAFSLVPVCIGLYLRDVEHIFGNTFYLDAGLFAPFFLITILTLASDTTFLSKAFSHPWLMLLGEASYAIYILHVPLRWWLQRILGKLSISLSLEMFLWIYIPSTIALSILCYKFIEVPTRDWLRKNTDQLKSMFLDIVLITTMIKLAFVIRLGIFDTGMLRTQRFTIFFGTVIFFAFMLLLRFYTSNSGLRLGLSMFLGMALLMRFVYYAWQINWIEAFPRSILIIIPVFVFSAIYTARLLIRKTSIKNTSLQI